MPLLIPIAAGAWGSWELYSWWNSSEEQATLFDQLKPWLLLLVAIILIRWLWKKGSIYGVSTQG